MYIDNLVMDNIVEFMQWVCEDLDIEQPGISFLEAENFPTETTVAILKSNYYTIFYNTNYVPDFPYAESMYYLFFATAHELRHIYQLKKDKNLFKDYILSNKTDLKSYNRQFVELDANKYAIKKMDEFNPDWDIYNIKETMKNENY